MKQVLSINDLAVMLELVNSAIVQHERNARTEYCGTMMLDKKMLPLSSKKVQEKLKADIYYQDLLHLKNALKNINVEIETTDIKIEGNKDENKN